MRKDGRVGELLREIRRNMDAGDTIGAEVAYRKLDTLALGWQDGRPFYSRVDVAIVTRSLG
jgi:hypothetical protein